MVVVGLRVAFGPISDTTDLTVSSLDSIVHDWNRDFITQIFVIDNANNTCERTVPGSIDLFSYDWPGTKNIFLN